jgi:hypothetical protein
MQEWFDRVQDSDRFCFATAAALEALAFETRVLDALILDLQVPGKPAQLKRLTLEEKVKAVQREINNRIEHPTSLFYQCHPLEVLSATIYSSEVPKTIKAVLWPAVKKEADLLAPVARYYGESKFEVYAEVPMGRNRIDLLAFRESGWFRSARLDGIELKNEVGQLKRGLDQMATFAAYTMRVFLACTPAMAAEYLIQHAKASNVKRWDSKLLHAKLERAGFGLMLVEGQQVTEVLAPREAEPSSAKIDEIAEHLTETRRVKVV